ncbi:uncharacterized protein LOC113465190 [Ceratina calcarata]|uniref:Uncharacterized protein LOC113465190 n=1 Tax=Ceratina calcarata TaxID=156304 RepID=A0AAJ7SBY9_9HYME|nr:uncharacterized protein LOC113465190 [Ceratina calcarata]
MFDRSLKLKTALYMILCEANMPENLSPEDWTFMKCFITVLEPFKSATEIMSGELYPTISRYYPMYHGLISVLEVKKGEEIDDGTGVLILNVCTKLQNALKERFESMLKDPWYTSAMISTLQGSIVKTRTENNRLQ